MTESEIAEIERRAEAALPDLGFDPRCDLCESWRDQQMEIAILRATLELIAAPKRPDGTYNRDREACEQLARKALAGSEGYA